MANLIHSNDFLTKSYIIEVLIGGYHVNSLNISIHHVGFNWGKVV